MILRRLETGKGDEGDFARPEICRVRALLRGERESSDVGKVLCELSTRDTLAKWCEMDRGERRDVHLHG